MGSVCVRSPITHTCSLYTLWTQIVQKCYGWIFSVVYNIYFIGERGKIFMLTMIVVVNDMIITIHMNILP